jgi:hypothetical protein
MPSHPTHRSRRERGRKFDPRRHDQQPRAGASGDFREALKFLAGLPEIIDRFDQQIFAHRHRSGHQFGRDFSRTATTRRSVSQ